MTGLIWEVKTDDGDGSIHDKGKNFNWTNSNENTGTFIKDLNDANFGGFSDWRLPTIKELTYLVDYGNYDPAINTGVDP